MKNQLINNLVMQHFQKIVDLINKILIVHTKSVFIYFRSEFNNLFVPKQGRVVEKSFNRKKELFSFMCKKLLWYPTKDYQRDIPSSTISDEIPSISFLLFFMVLILIYKFKIITVTKYIFIIS